VASVPPAVLPVPRPLHAIEPFFASVGAGVLPRGVVPALAQDRTGFLWVATGDGLVRFDGYRFQPQELDHPDPVRRNLGWVRALLATRDGKVWIGTENAGLAVYDPLTDRIALHPELGRLDAALPMVLALAEAADGTVWVAWHRGGLDRIGPDGRVAGRYRQAGRGHPALPDDRVQALLVDRQGRLWVGSATGLHRWQAGGGFEAVGAAGAALSDVQSLLQAEDGTLWAGTRQGEVLRLDATSGQVLGASGRGSAGPGAVTSLAQPSGGPVWVGRSTGIDWHDAGDGRLLRRLRQDPRRPDGLAADHVMTLLVDRAGWVWAGGLGLGLQRHNPRYNGITTRMADTAPGSPLADADVRGVLQLDNGDIWLATRRQGVLVLDAALQVSAAVRLPAWAGAAERQAAADHSHDGPGAAPGVGLMAQTRDGHVWLATDQGLVELDRRQRPLRRLALGGGAVYQLRAARDGGLWACTADGLLHLPPGGGVAQTVPVQGQGAAGQPVVLAVQEEQDGHLWVGTLAGLYHRPPGRQALLPVQVAPGEGLAHPAVIGLLLDSRRRLWLDTAVAGLHRLVRWDGEQAAFDRIGLRHGPAGPPFGANLLEDGRGRIWSQQNVYDPEADRLHSLGPAEGRHIGTGWFGAYAALADGRLLFGGSRGLLVVQPGHFEPVEPPSPLVLTGLRINGQAQRMDRLRDGLRLAPQERIFSVEFARLDFGQAPRSRYAWRLEGFDTDWIEAGADQRSAAFSNLAPGSYRLQVRAAGASGRWADPALELPVRVLPAWWQQWWARAAAVLALLLALGALVQWRTRHLRRREAELSHAVQQRTARLEQLTQALQRESAALQEASTTDPLTGLRNRRYLAQHIGADTAWAIRRHEDHLLHGAPPPASADLVFFLFDIDHFKSINDFHGHSAGDAVLQQIRSRLEAVFRDADAIVRWGGEEFLVVARGLNRRDAPELAGRALQALSAQRYAIEGGDALACSCSLGFAAFPLATRWPRALDWADTVNLADAALYLAKQEGRRRWVGVLDAGALGEEALHRQRPVQPWLAPGGVTVLRGLPLG
jgi:diguanylate cyclase (GGDEF)-like protein